MKCTTANCKVHSFKFLYGKNTKKSNLLHFCYKPTIDLAVLSFKCNRLKIAANFVFMSIFKLIFPENALSLEVAFTIAR